MNANIVRCGSCGNVVSSDLIQEEFAGACPWCFAGLSLPAGSGRRPTAVEELSPRSGPLPCDEPIAEMPPEAREAPETARFGRFIRVSLLGAGGMGEVWKAWDPALGRWVALKFLKMTDPRDLAWFHREAHVAATLSHPHIAAIHDVGEDRGLNYIAMQFVEGSTLEKLGRVDARRIAAILRDAARAVAHAHERGIIHRDLKPANLMVTGTGHLFVMDFGLARRIDSPSAYSIPGEAAGTPVYMSPAQAKGEPLDARADVYSLGATAYELLAGRPPIEGKSIHELIKNATDSVIRPLGEVAPSTPPELVSIVARSMAPDLESRYPSAREMADDLDRWLEGRPVLAHSAGLAYRARKFAARQVIAVAAIAAAVGIVAIVGVGAWRESRRQDELAKFESGRDASYVDAMGRGQAAWEEVVRYTSGSSAPELAAKKAAEARAHFEAAATFRGRAQAHLQRGRCLQVEGKIDEAVAAWQEAQKLDPKQEDARFEEAKAVVLKYQTSRGRPPGTVGRSANDPGGGTKFQAQKDTRPETDEQKTLRLKAEELLKGFAGKEHQNALLKGVMAVAGYEFKKGAELLERYTKAEPWDAQAMRLEALAWYYCNQPGKALPAINRALERTQDAPSYGLLGKVRIGADDDAGARDAYTKAIELDPKNPVYYLDRCYPNWRMNNLKEVEADATRVIELDPKSSRGYNARVGPRQGLGNLAGALADAEKVVELDPAKPSGYNARGLIKFKMKNFDGAIADLTKSMDCAADNKSAWMNSLEWRVAVRRGKWVALRDAGRPEEARESLKECIADQKLAMESTPDSVVHRTELSQLLREYGEAAAADAELAEAVKRNREVAANWFSGEAHRLFVDKKWAKSLEFYRRALDIDPLRPGQRAIYVWLIRAWLNERDAATAELATILDEKKLPFEEWDSKLTMFIAGRTPEEQLFKEAESTDEKTTKGRRCEAYFLAGERRFIGGDTEGARALYQRCLDLDEKLFLETRLARKRLEEMDKK